MMYLIKHFVLKEILLSFISSDLKSCVLFTLPLLDRYFRMWHFFFVGASCYLSFEDSEVVNAECQLFLSQRPFLPLFFFFFCPLTTLFLHLPDLLTSALLHSSHCAVLVSLPAVSLHIVTNSCNTVLPCYSFLAHCLLAHCVTIVSFLVSLPNKL